jgi:dephospho-CoA kinase
MIDREALARTVSEKSDLSLEQIERLFGGSITAENKAVTWRFLSMQKFQQDAIWQAFIRIRNADPESTADMKVEAIT